MVAKIPVLERIELPGKESIIELAFSFGSTLVDKFLIPIELKDLKPMLIDFVARI